MDSEPVNMPVAARRGVKRSGQWLQLLLAAVFAGALTALLVLGIGRANTLQSASSALQLAGQLTAQPEFLRSELTLLERELETRSYVGQSYDALRASRRQTEVDFQRLRSTLERAGLAHTTAVIGPMSAASSAWVRLDRPLSALAMRSDRGLYAESASGSRLTERGRVLKAAVDALLAERTPTMRRVAAQLGELDVALRESVTDAGRRLRELLLGASALAGLLLVLMLYYGWRSRQAASAAMAAERQVADILATVREGLFLLGRDLRLGATCSESLAALLRIGDPAGCSFEELLRPLVDEKTLTGALKYVGLLWKDRVREELIESVNPLAQIQVSFSSPRGEEHRYLSFSFRRVRSTERSSDFVLGSVADVTDRVLLEQELEQIKSEGDAQAGLVLQLLQADDLPLSGFLTSADAALRRSNAMLTAPGIEQQNLRGKLQGVFRELHTLKGEAGALGLGELVHRLHAVEDTLELLRARRTLVGDDFLPVVVKLDELMTVIARLQVVRERAVSLRSASDDRSASPGSPAPRAVAGAARAGRPVAPGELTEALSTLAQEVARAQGCSVRLVTEGLEAVPAHYAAVVRDAAIQLLRNAIVHGVEPGPERASHGKAQTGTVRVGFAADNPDDFMLSVEDDGRGLQHRRILERAIELGLLAPEQAATVEHSLIYRLIFHPRFSTATRVSEHAGRGVGLDAVSALVRAHGGRIGVFTVTGQFTRFKVLLPKAVPVSAESAA